MPAAFTADHIQHIIRTAANQELPPVVDYRIEGAVAILVVHDRSAVAEWAERLEAPMSPFADAPMTAFGWGDYQVRVVPRGMSGLTT